ncbi:MAG: TrkA family potassium uptake protein [Dehalococcoidia bacterium]|nr:TrkA family potassium uptake protein [Dehalococcoidia bacterium]
MRVVIMGCGRVGSTLAANLDQGGHEVTIVDLDSSQFRRLPAGFGGRSLVGNGIDQDVLRRAGIEEADAFVAVTQGDNHNVLASQIAKHVFSVHNVICRMYDLVREEFYQDLGLTTISPTKVISGMIGDMLHHPE